MATVPRVTVEGITTRTAPGPHAVT